MSRGHLTRPRSLMRIAVWHARSLLLVTERKEDSHATFPSNLEQTRVYFREMESLDDPLTAPRATCLLIDLGSCFYSAALRSSTTITAAAATDKRLLF